MHNGFSLAIAAVVVLTLAVLVVGVVSMLRGGRFNRRHGNRLMRARVLLQGVALVLILLFFLFGRA